MSEWGQIGLGGGCHWCTEAVFQSLSGVEDVQQGFIASKPPYDSFSEAVLLRHNPAALPLEALLHVHLATHASTSPHKMRGKYRSAVYVFSAAQAAEVTETLAELQEGFEAPLVTRVLPFAGFKPSPEAFQNYYQTDSTRPFCQTYIDPKLAKIRRDFARYHTGKSP